MWRKRNERRNLLLDDFNKWTTKQTITWNFFEHFLNSFYCFHNSWDFVSMISQRNFIFSSFLHPELLIFDVKVIDFSSKIITDAAHTMFCIHFFAIARNALLYLWWNGIRIFWSLTKPVLCRLFIHQLQTSLIFVFFHIQNDLWEKIKIFFHNPQSSWEFHWKLFLAFLRHN